MNIDEIKSACENTADERVVQKDFAWRSAKALRLVIEALQSTADEDGEMRISYSEAMNLLKSIEEIFS